MSNDIDCVWFAAHAYGRATLHLRGCRVRPCVSPLRPTDCASSGAQWQSTLHVRRARLWLCVLQEIGLARAPARSLGRTSLSVPGMLPFCCLIKSILECHLDYVQDCQDTFPHSSSLARHRLTHTGDRPFACTFEGMFPFLLPLFLSLVRFAHVDSRLCFGFFCRLYQGLFYVQ
jgi:hypothetical protein